VSLRRKVPQAATPCTEKKSPARCRAQFVDDIGG